MKFFIDTANIEQIKEAASIGILDGVTTNPSLIAKEEGTPADIFKEAVFRAVKLNTKSFAEEEANKLMKVNYTENWKLPKV